MKILVSANNPGGANSLLPVIQQLLKNGEELIIILEDKARDIFKKAQISFLDAEGFDKNKIDKLFDENNFHIFLGGSSLGKTIDKKLLDYCKERGLVSICVLDFWSNYWQRFSTEKKDFKFLPDYICVMDKKAKQDMTKEGFNGDSVIITGNPCFDHFVDNIKNSHEDKSKILFVSQPLESLDYGYDELSVLSDTIEALEKDNINCEVVVRLHPRDKEDKFNKILKKGNVSVFLDENDNLEESISSSGLILGMNSMVLFQSAVAGKKVISYQPNLKVNDCLISNNLGLSRLITKKSELTQALKDYFLDKDIISNDMNKDVIIKEATKKVIDFIYKAKTYVKKG